MRSKKRNTQYRIDQGFFPSYIRIFSCGEVCYIKDGKEYGIKWDIYSSVIYSFIFNRFNYFNNVQMSYEYIAAYCNCSVKTVMERVRVMEEAEIITIKRGKTLGGMQATNKYVMVEDLTQGNKFKLKKSKTYQTYQKSIVDKKKRLELLNGIRVGKGWTDEQARNFIRNRNYEIRTGTYLKGDKLNSKLYLTDRGGVTFHKKVGGFSGKDELKEYELKQLVSNAEVDTELDIMEELEPEQIIYEDLNVEDDGPLDDEIIPF